MKHLNMVEKPSSVTLIAGCELFGNKLETVKLVGPSDRISANCFEGSQFGYE